MKSEECIEIYANFGLAYYLSNCLEHCIVNAVFFLSISNKKLSGSVKELEDLIDNHFKKSFEKTLGELKKIIQDYENVSRPISEIIPYLDKCLVERNFLAHRFYKDYAVHWYSCHGRKEMLEKLESVGQLFRITYQKIDDAVRPLAEKYGLTSDTLENLCSKIKLNAELGHFFKFE